MAAAPNISAKITGDASGLQAELQKAQAGIKTFAGSTDALAGKFSSLLGAISSPLATLAGVIGGGAMLQGAINETVNWTKEANKLSKALGITTQEASVLNLAIGDIYGSLDEFLPAMGKITKTLASDEEAFRKLGVATRDAQGNLRPTTEIMAETNAALLKMKAGTDRNVEGVRIYGRSWAEAAKFLGLTPTVLKEAQEKAERLNLIVGSDSVEATKKYRASMNDLDDTVKALKIRLGNELLPTVTALNEEVAESGPTLVGALGGAFKWTIQFVYGLREQIEHFATWLGVLFRKVEVMASHLPNLLKAMADGIKNPFSSAKIIPELAKVKKELEEYSKLEKSIQASIDDKYAEKTANLWGMSYTRTKGIQPGGDTARSKEQRDLNKWQEEMNRLRQDGLKYLQDELLATKEQAELDGLLLTYEKEMESIRDKAKAQGWSSSQRSQAETQVALNAGNAWEAVTRKYTTERAKMEADLQATLTAQEEGGLAQRLEAVRKTFDEVRLKAAQLGKDAAFFDLIAGVEAERKRRAFVAQTKADLEDLKREMAELATIQGRALSLGEKLEILNRYQRARGTKSAAAQLYRDETHMDEAGFKGMAAGLREVAETGAMTWEDWKAQGLNGINAVTNAFAKGITGLINGTMSLRDALKSIWSDITQAIIQAVTQIIARFLVINALRFMFMGGAGALMGPTAFLGGVAAPMGGASAALAANIAGSERAVASYRGMGSSYASGAGSYAPPVMVNLQGAVIAGESAESARIIGDLVQRHLDNRNRRVG